MCLIVRRVTNATQTAMINWRTLLFLILSLSSASELYAQSQQGKVTYVTQSHYYIRLEGVEVPSALDSLQVGDLWVKVVAQNGAALVVEQGTLQLSAGDEVAVVFPSVEVSAPTESLVDQTDEVFLETPVMEQEVLNPAELTQREELKAWQSTEARGRLTTDFYGTQGSGNQMARTSQRASFQGNTSLAYGRLSVEALGTQRQYFSKGLWEHRRNIYQASVALETRDLQVSLGRQIPRNAGSLGAFDGVSATYSKGLSVQFIAGYRPDFVDFSTRTDQPLWGAFVSTPSSFGRMKLRGTAGLATYYGTDTASVLGVDRAMLFGQWSAQLTERVDWYSAVELDTYAKPEGQAVQRVLRPTGVYTSLNIRMTDRDRLFVSYDTRAPRIFYQQFDNELEQLLFDLGTQQGVRLRYSRRHNERLFLGAMATYRKQSTQTDGFILMNAYARMKQPFGAPGSLYAGLTYSQNASFNTAVGQLNYRQNFGKANSWMLYSRYLHYAYPGATVAASDRFYAGGQLLVQWADWQGVVRLESSIREGAVLPGIQAGITYRFKKNSKEL